MVRDGDIVVKRISQEALKDADLSDGMLGAWEVCGASHGENDTRKCREKTGPGTAVSRQEQSARTIPASTQTRGGSTAGTYIARRGSVVGAGVAARPDAARWQKLSELHGWCHEKGRGVGGQSRKVPRLWSGGEGSGSGCYSPICVLRWDGRRRTKPTGVARRVEMGRGVVRSQRQGCCFALGPPRRY